MPLPSREGSQPVVRGHVLVEEAGRRDALVQDRHVGHRKGHVPGQGEALVAVFVPPGLVEIQIRHVVEVVEHVVGIEPRDVVTHGHHHLPGVLPGGDGVPQILLVFQIVVDQEGDLHVVGLLHLDLPGEHRVVDGLAGQGLHPQIVPHVPVVGVPLIHAEIRAVVGHLGQLRQDPRLLRIGSRVFAAGRIRGRRLGNGSRLLGRAAVRAGGQGEEGKEGRQRRQQDGDRLFHGFTPPDTE